MVSRRWQTISLAPLLAASLVLGLSSCMPPPALTKAELDAKKTPAKHPRLSAEQKQNCRSCHREAPAIRN